MINVIGKNKNQNSDSTRFLEFNVGSEKFGLELLSVLEVISVPETTPLPSSPAYIKGIMNLRGQIITVVDLRKRLGITPLEDQSEKAVIISKVNGIKVGVIVDSINKVIQVNEDSLSEAIDTNKSKNSKYIDAIHKASDYLVFLLNFSKLLDLDEFSAA